MRHNSQLLATVTQLIVPIYTEYYALGYTYAGIVLFDKRSVWFGFEYAVYIVFCPALNLFFASNHPGMIMF